MKSGLNLPEILQMKWTTGVVSFENHRCKHDGWANLWNGSVNGSVKMRTRPRSREGTECLVALLVQCDEVAMQIVQEVTLCAVNNKAGTCQTS